MTAYVVTWAILGLCLLSVAVDAWDTKRKPRPLTPKQLADEIARLEAECEVTGPERRSEG